jgi:hypothetical protein
LGIIAIGSWAAGIYFRVAPPRAMGPGAEPSGQTAPSSTSSPGASSSASNGDTAAVPSSGSTTAGYGTAAAGSAGALDASAAPSDPAAVTACAAALFAARTFDRAKPDLSFVCTEAAPLRAVTRVQGQVALGQWGKRGMTEGMREWASLGWYQLAAFAVLRGRCCPSPPPYAWTFDLDCALDAALYELEIAARRKDKSALHAAAGQFDLQASCLTKRGKAPLFGQNRPPSSGAKPFERVLGRAR